ncbi:hypothetical protein GCM10029992_40390 [Glycomyces albus]
MRMRPQTLDELIGQDHLLTPGSPLRQIVEGRQPMSVILWGPPGSGKTTIAHLVAQADDRRFRAMSALNSGVKDVRAAIEEARRVRRTGGPQTILFIDEVHRFTKTQQDSLLGAVEDRTITLLAATTENPYFSVVAPLVSRCVLLTLRELGDGDVGTVIDRAIASPRGLDAAVKITDEARDHLVRTAGGDARKALTALEAAAATLADQASEGSEPDLTVDVVEAAIDTAAVRYDRDGDGHYDVASAFIKSLRGSDVDAAMHYLARMVVAGRTPLHSPPPGHLRLRGRRHGRPHRAPDRHRRRDRRRAHRHARGPHQPRPSRGPPGHRPQVQRRHHRHRRGRRRRARGQDRAGPGRSARRPLPRLGGARPRHRLRLPP